METRKAVLFGICLLAAGMAALAYAPGAPEPRAFRARSSMPAKPHVPDGAVHGREPMAEAAGDPFRLAPAELPPAPPVAPVAEAPAPVAPPFPYRYFGRMTGPDGKALSYLVRGDKPVPVRANEMLDAEYRVDAVSDTEIVVTYLPLNEQTSIATVSAN
jgi:hypothetical protein